MTFPGAPTVYYGDEVGVTGGEDPFNRATYPWEDEGGEPDTALLAEVKELIALRNDHDVLRRGTLGAPLHTDQHLVVLHREHEGVHAVTAYNNDTEAHEVTVDLPQDAAGQTYTDALTGAAVTPQDGRLTLTVAALDGAVLLSGTQAAPSIEALRADLVAATEAGQVTGPVVRVLTRDLDRAEAHAEAGRTRVAALQLRQFVRHLEKPGRGSTVAPEALDRLRTQAEALIAAWTARS